MNYIGVMLPVAAVLSAVVLYASVYRKDDSDWHSVPQSLNGVPEAASETEIMGLLQKMYAEASPLGIYKHLAGKAAERMAKRIYDKGFSVRGYDEFSLETPVDWASNPYQDENWRYQLNAIYPAAIYLEAYSLTGQEKWFYAALELYVDWVDFNILKNHANDWKWNDMATGFRGIYLAVLLNYGIRNDYLTEHEFRALVRAAWEHLLQLTQYQDISPNNHGLFQVAGVAAICHALPALKLCDKALPYASRKFEKLIELQFNKEGMHLEHSPSYHHLALKLITRFIELGWFKVADRHESMLEAAKANFHWLIKPDTTFTAIGDTRRAVHDSVREFHPTLEYMISNGQSGIRPPGGIRLFPSTGYGVFRHYSNDESAASAYVMLTVAHHSSMHKHADAFSFEWFDAGRSLLADAGKWGYDDTRARSYALSTRAHNTVEINNSDDSVQDVPPEIPVLAGVSEDGLYVLAADGVRHPFGVGHRRILVADPGRWLLVVDLLIGGRENERYTQWFHFAEKIRCSKKEGARFDCFDAGPILGVYPLMPVDEVELYYGARMPRYQGWTSTGYGNLEPAEAIGYVSRNAPEARFATLFRLHREGAGDMRVRHARVARDIVDICWKYLGRVEGALVDLGDLSAVSVRKCGG